MNEVHAQDDTKATAVIEEMHFVAEHFDNGQLQTLSAVALMYVTFVVMALIMKSEDKA